MTGGGNDPTSGVILGNRKIGWETLRWWLTFWGSPCTARARASAYGEGVDNWPQCATRPGRHIRQQRRPPVSAVVYQNCGFTPAWSVSQWWLAGTVCRDRRSASVEPM